MALLEELMQAALAATDERKREALEVLRGIRSKPVPATSGPQLLGMTAASRYLGISRGTLWRMIRAGRLQRVAVTPGFYRLRRADLDGIARQTEATPPTFPPCGGTAEPTHNMEQLP